MLETATGSLVIVNLNTSTPKYFWNGLELTEVLSIISHVDEDTNHIKLRVLDTDNFNQAYVEMSNSGIKIQKTRG